jgi:hypothetical protein
MNARRGFITSDLTKSEGVITGTLPKIPKITRREGRLPKGTVIEWAPFDDSDLDEEKEKLFRELGSFLGERGAMLLR